MSERPQKQSGGPAGSADARPCLAHDFKSRPGTRTRSGYIQDAAHGSGYTAALTDYAPHIFLGYLQLNDNAPTFINLFYNHL